MQAVCFYLSRKKAKKRWMRLREWDWEREGVSGRIQNFKSTNKILFYLNSFTIYPILNECQALFRKFQLFCDFSEIT